jgi:hypothetical protein
MADLRARDGDQLAVPKIKEGHESITRDPSAA